MTINFNNKIMDLPPGVETLAELAEWQNIPKGGTAIAINNSLARRESWSEIRLKDGDSLIVISAAFGG